MVIKTITLDDMHELVKSGELEEGVVLDFSERDNPEAVLFVNHTRKVLTARRGANRGKYIEVVEYTGLNQSPCIITFREGSDDYSRLSRKLDDYGI